MKTELFLFPMIVDINVALLRVTGRESIEFLHGVDTLDKTHRITSLKLSSGILLKNMNGSIRDQRLPSQFVSMRHMLEW